jgi:hypothetical protein
MVMSLYPVTQKNPQLAKNVVQMLDIGMGGQELQEEKADLQPIDSEFERIVNFAKQHYPNSKSKQEAFFKFVQRALGHSEEDDSRQDDEIEQLKREIDQIKNQLSQLSESNDYLEEKI